MSDEENAWFRRAVAMPDALLRVRQPKRSSKVVTGKITGPELPVHRFYNKNLLAQPIAHGERAGKTGRGRFHAMDSDWPSKSVVYMLQPHGGAEKFCVPTRAARQEFDPDAECQSG